MWTVRIVLLGLLGLFALATWQVGMLMDRNDMLWGLLFGTLAGIPSALLVLWAAGRSDAQAEDDSAPYRPTTEDDAPTALWPAQFTAFGIDGTKEMDEFS